MAPQSHSSDPRPEDVGTPESIILALYEVISGPAGAERDWARFRSLFLPEARLVLAVSSPLEHPRIAVLGVDDYIRRTAPIFARENFWECQRDVKIDKFGNIAQAWSIYESRREKNGPPFQEGVNSIQLFNDTTRWWIATVMWNTEQG